MEHTRMRFRTMTESQLWTRLNRVTKEDKLMKFEAVAREFGYARLANAVAKRYNELYGNIERPRSGRSILGMLSVDQHTIETVAKRKKKIREKKEEIEENKLIRVIRV